MITRNGPLAEYFTKQQILKRRPTPCRQGVANRELIVIFVSCCLALGFVLTFVPSDEQQGLLPDTTNRSVDSDLLPRLVVSLDRELLGTVRLVNIGRPSAENPSRYVSQILLARRDPVSNELQLLDAVMPHEPSQAEVGIARVWTLVDFKTARERFPVYVFPN